MPVSLLAVADEPSRFLEHYFRRPAQAREPFDLLVSCGDLDAGYLDYLVTNAACPLFYVNGNHRLIPRRDRPGLWDLDAENWRPGQDLHGRIVRFQNLLLCGFEGARAAVEAPGYYTEAAMARVTGRVERRLARLRLWERLGNRPPEPLIVISHAPPAHIHDQSDGIHQGFDCFRRFLERNRPQVWLHGHIHLGGFNQIQRTDLLGTAVMNAYEFKRVRLTEDQVILDYQLH